MNKPARAQIAPPAMRPRHGAVATKKRGTPVNARKFAADEEVLGFVAGTSPEGMTRPNHYTHEDVRWVSRAVCSQHATGADDAELHGRAVTTSHVFDAPIFCSVECHTIPVTLTEVGRGYVDRLSRAEDPFARSLASVVSDPRLTWETATASVPDLGPGVDHLGEVNAAA